MSAAAAATVLDVYGDRPAMCQWNVISSTTHTHTHTDTFLQTQIHTDRPAHLQLVMCTFLVAEARYSFFAQLDEIASFAVTRLPRVGFATSFCDGQDQSA